MIGVKIFRQRALQSRDLNVNPSAIPALCDCTMKGIIVRKAIIMTSKFEMMLLFSRNIVSRELIGNLLTG